MHLAHYLGLLHRSETELARAFCEVAAGTATRSTSRICASASPESATDTPSSSRRSPRATARRRPTSSSACTPSCSPARSGGLGLLRDLHDLYLMATECDLSWTLVGQAAQGARDRELLGVVQNCEQESATQLKWLQTRMKQAAPQALVVAR